MRSFRAARAAMSSGERSGFTCGGRIRVVPTARPLHLRFLGRYDYDSSSARVMEAHDVFGLFVPQLFVSAPTAADFLATGKWLLFPHARTATAGRFALACTTSY